MWQSNAILKSKRTTFRCISKFVFVWKRIKLANFVIQKLCNWVLFCIFWWRQKIFKNVVSNWAFWNESLMRKEETCLCMTRLVCNAKNYLSKYGNVHCYENWWRSIVLHIGVNIIILISNVLLKKRKKNCCSKKFCLTKWKSNIIYETNCWKSTFLHIDANNNNFNDCNYVSYSNSCKICNKLQKILQLTKWK